MNCILPRTARNRRRGGGKKGEKGEGGGRGGMGERGEKGEEEEEGRVKIGHGCQAHR